LRRKTLALAGVLLVGLVAAGTVAGVVPAGGGAIAMRWETTEVSVPFAVVR